ncbi:hypothetical protein K4K59_001910 [Colletotrichum sp. SAR11_240]|nr:hypothetical protein K4K59_001910 [Colletotrichum sp. SAR11_240]
MVPEPIFNDTDDAAEAIQDWEFFRLPVSTQWITFEDRVASLAIERMVGCHAIILVSRWGAFVCHFYEDSFFDLYSARTTMTACLRGLPEDDPSRAWHEYGIEDVRDNPEDGKRGVILGNQEDSDGQYDFEDIDAFIITPRARPGYGSFGSGLTFERIDELIMAPDVNAGRLPGIARQLNGVKQALAELFVDIPIKTIDYPPAMFTCEEWFRRRGTERTLDFSEALRDSIVDTPRGKVLLQYKPAPSCDQEAQHNHIDEVQIILGIFEIVLRVLQTFVGHFEVRRSYLKADIVDKASQHLRSIHRPIDDKDHVSNQQRPADVRRPKPKTHTVHETRRSRPLQIQDITVDDLSLHRANRGPAACYPGSNKARAFQRTQGVWEMFVAGVRAEVDLCDTEDVGHEFQSYFRPSEWFDDKRPPSFEADQAIFGRKNCKYKEGGKLVPGRFSCDGVDEFDCRLSDRPNVKMVVG